jgi:uncharacterized protein YecT (DUF1311 family)
MDAYLAQSDVGLLEKEWIHLGTSKHAYLFRNYVPIRLVTLIEVGARSSIKELIDHGDPYLENAKAHVQNFKLDYGYVLALHRKKITIGEMIAHSVPTNSIDQILSALTELVPTLNDLLLRAKDRVAIEIDGEPDQPIISDLTKTIGTLDKLFRLRHIIVHEMPSSDLIEEGEFQIFFGAAKNFLSALAWITSELVSGHVPLTQADMNIQSAENLDKTISEFKSLLDKLRESDTFDLQLLDAAQSAWQNSVEADAALVASQVSGGSMYPMVYTSELSASYDERISAIKRWLEIKDEQDK